MHPASPTSRPSPRPAGRRDRRGSFLVLVVGTLALLAVITIIYVTIGNQDLRTRAAANRQERLDDVPDQLADYIAGIIADDVVATYNDGTRYDVNAQAALHRETADYPYTPYSFRSEGGTAIDRFEPVGTYPAVYAGFTSASAPARPPSDPWLASTEPVWLNFFDLPPSGPELLQRRDWMQISNVAPDGRFVNLFNLRDNFDAVGGIGSDADGRLRMSNKLLLLDEDGRVSSDTDWNTGPDPNRPAYWTMRQRGLFRPVADVAVSAGSDEFLPYQYADADGDGMYDSRWFELARTEGPATTRLLDTDGKYRYFFAVRIADLSALVNVNTAGDLRAAPSAEVPAGLTPAEIDLRRLLTNHDVYDFNENGPFSADFEPDLYGYNGFDNPTDPKSAENYGRVGAKTGMDVYRAFHVGDYAYDAVRLSLAAGHVPPAFSYADGSPLRGSNLTLAFARDVGIDAPEPRRLFDLRPPTPGDPDTPVSAVYLPEGGAETEARAYFYYAAAATSSGTRTDRIDPAVPANNTLRATGVFGLDDLTELLTRRAVNDPSVTTALEVAIGGRDPVDARYSPLRSNRTLAHEAARYDVPPSGTLPSGPGSAMLKTMLHFDADLRQRLTTLSGSRTFRDLRHHDSTPQATTPRVRGGVPYDALIAAELRPSLAAIQADLGGNPDTVAGRDLRARGLGTLFGVYADALAGHSGALNAWGGTTVAKVRTLFYGHNGPELALHVAGHMAVNMADMADPDDEPTIHTMPIRRDFFSFIQSEPDAFPDWKRTRFGDRPLNALELPGTRLAPTGSVLEASAVRMFGIEPQPFLTGVISMTVYSDTDDDGEAASTTANIRGDVDAVNTDAIYQLVGFQLHNPFNQAVTLSGSDFHDRADALNASYPDATTERSFYYIEFGDKVYKLARLEEPVYSAVAPGAGEPGIVDPANADKFIYPPGATARVSIQGIEIPPRSTVVCYALSQTQQLAFDRLQAGNSKLRTEIENIIEESLGRGEVSGVYWVPEIDVNLATGTGTGKPVIAATPPSPFRQLVPDPLLTPEVRLWRVLRPSYAATPSTLTTEMDATDVATRPYWDGKPSGSTVLEYGPNDPANDQLVDRLRLPAGHDLGRGLPAGQNEIDGTDYLTDQGHTLTLWASVRRPDDPGTATDIPLGAFPAFCLEPKFVADWNISEIDEVDPLPLDNSDFGAGYDGAHRSIDDWKAAMNGNNVVPVFAEAPEDRNPIYAEYIDARTNVDPTIGTAGSRSYRDRYAEVIAATGTYRSADTFPGSPDRFTTIRPADLLLPMGIGPSETPLDVSGNTLITDLGQRWTTLAEAMAMALGYESIPFISLTAFPDDAHKLYHVEPVAAAGPDPDTLLDRGNLDLDLFVPFYDEDEDGRFDDFNDDGQYDNTLGANADVRRGTSESFAMSIPGMVSGLPASAQSLTRAAPGLVNINTAPLAVLRTLPMLSPPPYLDTQNVPAGPTPPPAWWWWGTDVIGDTGPLDDRSDIAATIAAYRDKLASSMRPLSSGDASLGTPGWIQWTPSAPYPVPDRVVFRNRQIEGTFAPVADIDDPSIQPNGRYNGTRVGGIDENPGFRTVGGLLNSRWLDWNMQLAPVTVGSGSATSFADTAFPFNIDFLGYDDFLNPDMPQRGNSARPGVDSVAYGATPDELVNEYKEKLAVVNSVLNSVTNRSDYFVVWFIVHGYQQSDVTNLALDDPMVPTVQRRFLMIVDRSNVTVRGQKPRILAFKEVPM